MAGDRADVSLVAPDPEFVYKPLLVEEPFGLDPAERHALAPLAKENGAEFLQASATAIDPDKHQVELSDGSKLDYDLLLVAVGGRYRPAYQEALTFPSAEEPLDADVLLTKAHVAGGDQIAFVVPPGVTW